MLLVVLHYLFTFICSFIPLTYLFCIIFLYFFVIRIDESEKNAGKLVN